MRALRFLMMMLEALLPSTLRIWLLRRRGATIGAGCHIGAFTILDASNIHLGDCVQIASFNLVHRLSRLDMGNGSRMNGFNWITGAGTGRLEVGKNSAITRFHFFEASGDITIGENSIIAGRDSHFFTHGISATNLDDVRSIRIGSWCYIGSSSRFVPGSGVSKGTFVGMGSVVTKPFTEEFLLIAGNPAQMKKQLSSTDVYFDRAFLPHDHHPTNYRGG
ncbi:MAG TPA: hypothetical protein DCL54_03235 [Alphaproteobacteria bacterium]|nr:hypothetical protein [Alphaproteobacteria bacterium]